MFMPYFAIIMEITRINQMRMAQCLLVQSLFFKGNFKRKSQYK